MDVLRGLARGQVVEFEEPLPYNDGQVLTVYMEPSSNGFPLGSPQRLLQTLANLPDLDAADVDALEQAIGEGRLPLSDPAQLSE